MLSEPDVIRDVLPAVARDFGTPCYVYVMDLVRARVGRVRAAFGNRFRIRYAVKSNPNSTLLRRLKGVVDSVDVSSGGEVVCALEAGWDAPQIGFTGPGKTERELLRSIDVGLGEVVVESAEEAELLNRLAAQRDRHQRIVVRIAPSRMPRGFGVNMSGKPTQFGIDEEDIDAALRSITKLPHLRVIGLHIYSGTQCLHPEAIVENFRIFIELFRRVCQTHDLRPQILIFGSGIGIPYYESDAPVDLDAVADAINPDLDALRSEPRFASAVLALETGRYLVGEAGFYLTRVLRMKHSRGTDICICDGGMNHHLGAAGHLGTVLQRNYRMLKLMGDDTGDAPQPYNLVGPLCTTIDTLARQVSLPALKPGDVIVIRSSGAYGLTASPIHFIGHAPPREIIVETVDGHLTVEDVSQLPPDRSVRQP
jgi:diaminopimelate decarboxylase